MHSSAVAGVLLLHELFTSPTLPAIHLYHHRHQMVSAKWHNKQLYIFTLSGLLHSCQLYWIGRALSKLGEGSKILQRQYQPAFLWSFFQNIPKGLDALAMLGSPIGLHAIEEVSNVLLSENIPKGWDGLASDYWLVTMPWPMGRPIGRPRIEEVSNGVVTRDFIDHSLPSFLLTDWPASTVSKRKGGFKCSDEYPFPIIHPP